MARPSSLRTLPVLNFDDSSSGSSDGAESNLCLVGEVKCCWGLRFLL